MRSAASTFELHVLLLPARIGSHTCARVAQREMNRSAVMFSHVMGKGP